MTASAPSRFDVFCPTDAPDIHDTLKFQGYTGGNPTKVARYLIARTMHSEPRDRLLPHYLPTQPLIQAMWSEGWLECNESSLGTVLRAINTINERPPRRVLLKHWRVAKGEACPQTGITAPEDMIGYTLVTEAVSTHMRTRVVDVPQKAAKLPAAVAQDPRLHSSAKHFYAWCLAIGAVGGFHRLLKVRRSALRKAVEESSALPGKTWSLRALRDFGKRLTRVGLLKDISIPDTPWLILTLNDPQEQYATEVWDHAVASEPPDSGLPTTLDRVMPCDPSELIPAVLGDPQLSITAKHVYGYLMARVHMSGDPVWRAPYLIPTDSFITRLNADADEAASESVTDMLGHAAWDRARLTLALVALKKRGLLRTFGFASQGPHAGCLRYRPIQPRSAYSVKAWNEREKLAETPEGRLSLLGESVVAADESSAPSSESECEPAPIPLGEQALLAILIRMGDLVTAAQGKVCSVKLSVVRGEYESLRPEDRPAVTRKLRRAAAGLAERGLVEWVAGFKTGRKTKTLRYRVTDAGLDWAALQTCNYHSSLKDILTCIRAATKDGRNVKEALREHVERTKHQLTETQAEVESLEREQTELAARTALLIDEAEASLSPEALLLMYLILNKLAADHGDFSDLEQMIDCVIRYDSEVTAKGDFQHLASERSYVTTDSSYVEARDECVRKGFLSFIPGPGLTLCLTQTAVDWAIRASDVVKPYAGASPVFRADGTEVQPIEVVAFIKEWHAKLDLTSYHDRFPNVTLFHESVVNNDSGIGPYERRVLALQLALEDLHSTVAATFGNRAIDLVDLSWSRLLPLEEQQDRLGKSLARLVRAHYARLPGMSADDKAQLRKVEDETPDAEVDVQIGFPHVSKWADLYSETYLKIADRIAQRHGATTRKAQLTLPHHPCPCASGATAELCCQVHSLKRTTLLHNKGGGDLAAICDAHATPVIAEASKVQRNDPCPCWSGKKWKKCCGRAGRTYVGLSAWFAASWRGTA